MSGPLELLTDKSGFSQPLLRLAPRKEPLCSHLHFIIKGILKDRYRTYEEIPAALTLGHFVACGVVLVQLPMSCHTLSCPEAPTMSYSHNFFPLMPVHGIGDSDSLCGNPAGCVWSVFLVFHPLKYIFIIFLEISCILLFLCFVIQGVIM